MQKENEFHKIGLFGITIKNASDEIKSLNDIINWLKDMDELYTKGSDKHWWGQEKSNEKGMKCLHNSIDNGKLNKIQNNSFPSLLNLVVILQDISIGSKKAWRGRTKQMGFQKTLNKCKEVIENELKTFVKNKLKVINEIDEEVEKNIVALLEEKVFKKNDKVTCAGLKSNVMSFLKSKLKKDRNLCLNLDSVNDAYDGYAKFFELEKNNDYGLKKYLILYVGVSFLNFDQPFKGNKECLEDIILWMHKLHESANSTCKKAQELGIPDMVGDWGDENTYTYIQTQTYKCKEVTTNWKDIKEIQSEFFTAGKKEYLKYLWLIFSLLRKEPGYLKYPYDFCDNLRTKIRKTWCKVAGPNPPKENSLFSKVISSIGKKLINNKSISEWDACPSIDHPFTYAELKNRENDLRSKLVQVLGPFENKENNELKEALDLIKRFNENYDKTPLIDISGYIKNF